MNPLRAIRATVNNLIASGAGLITVVPIYLVFVNAVKTSADASSLSPSLPRNPQWGNISAVIDQAQLGTAFFNSVLYSFGSMILAVVLSALAAYVLARHRSRRHDIIYFLLILGIAVPTNFVTLSHVMLITHLIDTQLGYILVFAATQIPFDVFLIYAFIGSVPKELDEAAFIDGSSPIRCFFSVIMPLLTPVLVTCGVLNILNCWNEFLLPLYLLGNSSKWPMSLSVYNFFGLFSNFVNSNWAYVSADVALTILPVIVIYLIAQRWILAGVFSGAVKG